MLMLYGSKWLAPTTRLVARDLPGGRCMGGSSCSQFAIQDLRHFAYKYWRRACSMLTAIAVVLSPKMMAVECRQLNGKIGPSRSRRVKAYIKSTCRDLPYIGLSSM